MIVFTSMYSVIPIILDIVAKYLFAEDGTWFSNIIYIPDKVVSEYRATDSKFYNSVNALVHKPTILDSMKSVF